MTANIVDDLVLAVHTLHHHRELLKTTGKWENALQLIAAYASAIQQQRNGSTTRVLTTTALCLPAEEILAEVNCFITQDETPQEIRQTLDEVRRSRNHT